MNNAELKDTRILEAFDYIDPKYIAEVAESLKLKSVRTKSAETESRRTPFRLWKQFAALAACLILLSFASTGYSYVVEFFNSIAAGLGSGTTSDFSDTIECYATTEPLVSEFDPDYVLTEEEFSKFAQIFKEYFNREILDYHKECFYGKCGDSIVFWTGVNTFTEKNVIIEEFLFTTPNGELIWVENNSIIYSLSEAYEKGILSYRDIIQIHKKHCQIEGFSGEKIK